MAVDNWPDRADTTDDKIEALGQRFEIMVEVMNKGFISIHRRFERVDQGFVDMRNEMDRRFDVVDSRMNKGFAEVNRRLDQVDDRLEGHDRQFDSLGSEVKRQGVMMEVMDDKIVALAEGHQMLYDKIVGVDGKVEAIGRRLDAVEIGLS